MNWEGKRVLVTGAAGFIGSHLTEALVSSGATVRALDLYNTNSDCGNLNFLPPAILDSIEIVLSDIRDPHAVRSAVRDQEIVFHLAALIGIPYSYLAPRSYLETNVMGTLNVLEACRAEGVEHIVHTSTSETYGTARYTPIDEEHPLQGQSPYSASKIAADKLAESYFLSFGLPVTTIRPFNTYGPRQSARAIIPTVVSQGLVSDELKIGSLSPRRDLNYVVDTVRGFMSIGAHPEIAGQVINIGFGEDISIGKLIELIGKILGKSFGIKTDPQRVRPDASEVMQLIACNERARSLVGWEPEISLTEGLSRTVAWIRDHRDRYDTSNYSV